MALEPENLESPDGIRPSDNEGEAEEMADDSIHMTLLNHYDELDRLRTLVIPPLEDQVKELKEQIRLKDGQLLEAHKEIEALRRQLLQSAPPKIN